FHWSIDTEMPTLASVLGAHGYVTHGYVSHVTLTPSYGIGNDFHHYDYSVLDVGHPHDVATAKPLTERALDGLARVKEPYFLWVHYFDPHFEYLSHPAFAKWGARDIDRYDGEIAHTDYYIGKLLRAVDEDHTVIVFTADHGEEFGEHAGKYHYTLHQEVMRVPLVVKAPGLPPRAERGPVEQVDLMPTVLALLGVEASPGLPGRDLFAPPAASAAGESAPVFIERDRPPPWRQQGVIVGASKLFVVQEIDSSSIPPAGRGTEVPVENVRAGIYLYDLAADPGERTNLYSESDAKAMELLGVVAEHFATRRFQETAVDLDPELIQKLRSLGYLR
ncbi:MAG: sulfatase, partial [Candidatus Krumholzibacteria bacterium]|nr:sulfatase [Candidatus Krumholzibacteria bacterium]